MPADLPFSPRDDLSGEFTRWLTEFEIRPEGFSEYDEMDLRSIGERFLKDEGDRQEFVDQHTGFIESLRTEQPTMDRLPVLHVTRENLGEVDRRGELPEGFIDDITAVTADYINGFIPDQDITPPEASHFDSDIESDKAGSYSFRRDRSKLYPKGGDVENGSSAATVSAHETMHKNNVEALIPDPMDVRSYAWIYEEEAPPEFREVVESSGTASLNHDLLGGLALMYVDEFYDAGILSAYRRDDIEPENIHEFFKGGQGRATGLKYFLEEFSEAIDMMENAYNLEFFDVRDEAICQAVSFFMDGAFEEGFDSRLESKRNHYNDNDAYSERAGDAIVNHLRGIRSEFEDVEGLRGESFRNVMEKRIPFLKGNDNFSKY